MAQYHDISLRALTAIAKDGDTITDCTLIATVPNTPICKDVRGLRLERCRFIRCAPPRDAITIGCRENQNPLPPKPKPVREITLPESELSAVIGDITSVVKRRAHLAKYGIVGVSR